MRASPTATTRTVRLTVTVNRGSSRAPAGSRAGVLRNGRARLATAPDDGSGGNDAAVVEFDLVRANRRHAGLEPDDSARLGQLADGVLVRLA